MSTFDLIRLLSSFDLNRLLSTFDLIPDLILYNKTCKFAVNHLNNEPHLWDNGDFFLYYTIKRHVEIYWSVCPSHLETIQTYKLFSILDQVQIYFVLVNIYHIYKILCFTFISPGYLKIYTPKCTTCLIKQCLADYNKIYLRFTIHSLWSVKDSWSTCGFTQPINDIANTSGNKKNKRM